MTTLGNGVVINETLYNSPNYTPASAAVATYGRPRIIRGITIHHWGVDGQNIHGISSYLCRPGGNTSAHFSVQDGAVYCLVSPTEIAWHAGSAQGNAETIGIECRPEMSAGDIETLCHLIVWLESVYGEMKIYGHQDWSATACPGRYYPQLGRIIDRVNQLKGGTPLANPVTSPKPASTTRTANDPHWGVSKGDSLSKIARYYYGQAGKEELDKLVKHNGLKSANSLSVGQKIYIPGPLVWTVEPGDTWSKINGYYGFADGAVQSRNPGVSLRPGVALKVWG